MYRLFLTIADSQIGQGLLAMVNDISNFLLIWGPIACGAFAVYCIIRRGMADEHEGKMWQNRIIISVICAVGVFLVSGAISLFGSYFKG